MTYQRAEHLTPQEASLYQAALREFPEQGGAPDAAWLTTEAAERRLDAAMVLARLEVHDL